MFFDTVLTEYGYFELFGLTTLYFFFLYFGLGWVYRTVCQLLARAGVMEVINNQPYPKDQLYFEIRHSLYSIVVFGISALPLAYLVRCGSIELAENTVFNTIKGLVLLTLWNEVHFYTIHRILHYPWLMKHVHRVHHRSVVPSVYSVYSFHPLESLLLSSVLLTIAPFFKFCSAALMLFPTVSILINFSGHSNYRVVLKSQKKWLMFSTKHNKHHGKSSHEFGFMTNFMDWIFTK